MNSTLTSSPAREHTDFRLRRPTAVDGRKVHALIARCPPLDTNSLYCNLLQCTFYASTCVLAERHDEPIGFISAFVEPENPQCVFVWQVAVAPEARGLGLGLSMLLELLARPACAEVHTLHTTITPDNGASWALFNSLARRLGTAISDQVQFDRTQHFDNRHDSELLVTIGRFPTAAPLSDH